MDDVLYAIYICALRSKRLWGYFGGRTGIFCVAGNRCVPVYWVREFLEEYGI